MLNPVWARETTKWQKCIDKLASPMRRCMGRALSDRAGLRRAEKKLEDEKN